MNFKTQRIAYPYFVVALLLFALQLVVGLYLAFSYFFTVPQAVVDVFPFATARAMHTNLLVLWLLLGFMGATYYLVPEETATEIIWPRVAVFQLALLSLTGVVALIGFFFGWTQGRPLLEIPTPLDFVVVIIFFARMPALGGWTLPEIGLLYGLSSVAFGLADMAIAGFDYAYFGPNMVRLGEFDRVLIRPVNLFVQVLSSQFTLKRLGRIGQGAIVLCEAFSMTGDEALRVPAQKAIDFIVAAQYPDGGWRYYPRRETQNLQGDTSVVGWQLMALQSALAAGLSVPDSTLENAGHFLDTVQRDEGAKYAYLPREQPTAPMTAEAQLCRIYLGWKRTHPPLAASIRWMLEQEPPSADRPNIYYWYYATQLLHNMKNKDWERWNPKLREGLIHMQVKEESCSGGSAPCSASIQGRNIRTTLRATCNRWRERIRSWCAPRRRAIARPSIRATGPRCC